MLSVTACQAFADDVQFIKQMQQEHERAAESGNQTLQLSFYERKAQQWMADTLQKAISYPKEKLLELPCHESIPILQLRNDYDKTALETLSPAALLTTEKHKSPEEIGQLDIVVEGDAGFIITHGKAHLKYTRENGRWKISLEESHLFTDTVCAFTQKIQNINNVQLLLLTLEKQGIPLERGMKLLRGPL